MPTCAMIRHGQSTWNRANRFTGWTDVELTERGIVEAQKSGVLLRNGGYVFDRAYTSVLKRAIKTLWLALEEMDAMWLPLTTAWELNERHYGALQGLNKAETAKKHSAEQVHIWRRSYDTAPPAVAQDDERHPKNDPRYAHVDPARLPDTESLKATLERVLPYWQAVIEPVLAAGQNVIIAAHGNSQRALVKHLLDISDEDIPGLEIPTGNPLIFELNEDLKVTHFEYLDEARAAKIPGR
ncbi:MAG: 2,3-diphosphoglycerate-dependent phosphoglycerate mutase [Alphaproteobacteria bacterium]|nr:2,3-diphosphoglycerate-dependent phosphoglycerate mutase [Alphaproteobacteria bacterium]